MIVRTAERDRFAIISKTPLEDDRLSFKARGLLAYLLSKPDGWDVQVSYLIAAGPDGKRAVESALAELEQAGYLERGESERDQHGHFTHRESVIFEEPTVRRKAVADGGAKRTADGSAKCTTDGGAKCTTSEEGVLVITETPTVGKIGPSAILRIWNDVFKKRYTVPGWGDRIAACLKAHPEVTIDEHRALIEHEHAHPWWSPGRPVTPALQYGSIKQFERCLYRDAGSSQAERINAGLDLAFGTGS